MLLVMGDAEGLNAPAHLHLSAAFPTVLGLQESWLQSVCNCHAMHSLIHWDSW